MRMRNIAMLVSYDGTKYEGFQTQPSGNTIQDAIERAIEHLTGEKIKITGSGRTDAGVHAHGQVFNFITTSRIPIERWTLAMNSRLPHDIVIQSALMVPTVFHSRKSAIGKTYRYTIWNHPLPDVFAQRYQLHHPRSLDVEAMRQGLEYLVGEHDFTSYCSPKATGDSRVRTIYSAEIVVEAPSSHPSANPDPLLQEMKGKDLFSPVVHNHSRSGIHIYVTGNGFLYHMVRIIIGTLLLVGQGKLKAEDMQRILEAKDRSLAGPTAPAHGLTLWRVYYPNMNEPSES